MQHFTSRLGRVGKFNSNFFNLLNFYFELDKNIMLSKPKGNSQGHGYSEKEGLGKTATVLKLNYRQI